MLLRNSKNFSFPGQIAIFLMLIGASLMVSSLISGFVIWPLMTGTPVSALQSGGLKGENYYALIVLQAVTTFFIFFLSTWIFALICYRKPKLFLGLSRNFNINQVLLILVIMALTIPISGFLADLARSLPLPPNLKSKFDAMEAAREAQEAVLIKINSFPKYIISIVLIGILPAIFEEVFFRGGIQNILTRWFKGPWAAILITSFIFSIIHLSFYGFFVRFALGVILGFIFYYSANLWLPILLHFVFNGLQVTALYILNFTKTTKVKDLEGGIPWWMAIISIAILIFVFQRFKAVTPPKQQDIFYEDEGDEDFHDWIAKNH